MRLSLSKNLIPLRLAAKRKIDQVAEEEVRVHFITPGSGQAMVYQQKVEEAEALVANPQINPNEIPHIVLEAQAMGTTPFDLAVTVLTMREQWKVVSSMIETRRLAAKARVDLAQTPAAIDAASEVDWTDIVGMAL